MSRCTRGQLLLAALAALAAVLLLTPTAASVSGRRSLAQVGGGLASLGNSNSANYTGSQSTNRPLWLQLLQSLIQFLRNRSTSRSATLEPDVPGKAVSADSKPGPADVVSKPPMIPELPTITKAPGAPSKALEKPLEKPLPVAAKPEKLPTKQPPQDEAPLKKPLPTPVKPEKIPIKEPVLSKPQASIKKPSKAKVCKIPNSIINDFAHTIHTSAKLEVEKTGVVYGYYRQKFTKCDADHPKLCNGSTYNNKAGHYQNGYCIDTTRPIKTNKTYDIVAYSSYAPVGEMTCQDAKHTPLSHNITNNTLRRINWLINNYYNPSVGVNRTCHLKEQLPAGKYQSTAATKPGRYGPPSRTDMQAAVWAMSGDNRFAGNIKSDNDVVNCLVHSALTANVTQHYRPPCGGTVAVVLIPCDRPARRMHRL